MGIAIGSTFASWKHYHTYLLFIGGWLRVSFFDTYTSPDYNFDAAKVLYDDPAVAIQKARSFYRTSSGISFDGLKKLKQTMSFTQMRFYCSKNGTRSDMITTNDEKGRAVVDYFTSNSTVLPDACGSFSSHGNNKLMKSCEEWNEGGGKWGDSNKITFGNERLYGMIASITNHSFSMGLIRAKRNKFLCDDNESSDLNGGRWLIFVR